MIKSIFLSTLFSLLVLAQETQERPPNQPYNGGEDNPQNPDDAGAEGSTKGAFTISKGGLAAIIVVAVVVAVGGIASAVLFWLAKKRQWDVRQSIRRASRRLTGRAPEPSKRQNRRTGVRLNSPPAPKSRQNRDVEKGVPAASQYGKTTTTISSTFAMDTSKAKGSKAPTFGRK